MNKPVVLIGTGEMGGVFARGLLRDNYSIIPVNRSTDILSVASEMPNPEMVLVAVAEKDLQSVLINLPDPWRINTVLLQNELLPRDWAPHQLRDPTIISVWFEKKKGQDYKVLIPSPAYGPNAANLQSALKTLDIPVTVLHDEDELLHQLVLKNLYIVTTNVAGLETGGTVSELWSAHRDLCKNIANDVIDIQEYLTAKIFDNKSLINDMLIAFDGDPDHQCMGRSAPARLQRALEIADEGDLAVKHIRAIDRKLKEKQAEE